MCSIGADIATSQATSELRSRVSFDFGQAALVPRCPLQHSRQTVAFSQSGPKVATIKFAQRTSQNGARNRPMRARLSSERSLPTS